MGLLRYLSEAQSELTAMGEEFACIENAPGVFPPCEIVPLGAKFSHLDGPPAAIFLDMDGTTTYTEPLFLHDVEEVVRRGTGWKTKAASRLTSRANRPASSRWKRASARW